MRLKAWRHTSHLLGIHFELTATDMVVTYPDGTPFRSLGEEAQLRREAETRAHEAEMAADRLRDLSRKVTRGQASPEELAELRLLLGDE